MRRDPGARSGIVPLSTMTVAILLLLLPVFIDLSATEAESSPIVSEPHAPDQVPLAGRSAIRLQTYARFMIDISSLARQEGRSDDQLATDQGGPPPTTQGLSS